MKRILGIAIAAALFLAAGVALAAEGAPDRLAGAALAGKRPVVVDFGKGQCTQCIRQGEAIEEVKGAVGEKVGFEFVHVIKEAELTGRYKVLMIPTLVFLDATGKEVDRFVGLMDTDDLSKKLKLLGWVK